LAHPTALGGANLSIAQGGALIADTSDTIVSGTNASGAFSIANNTATHALLENGGVLTVLGGASSIDTIVNSGGRELVSSGGVASGTTLNSSGTQSVLAGASALGATVNRGGA
ncbi:autotransporter outer membrane beta-barrel domain-containing protein, partial [Mesorhizobium sp. M3A.F.Ca.ET.174.01.1.1]